MTDYTIKAGANTGTTGNDFFDLTQAVGNFTVDGLDGLDEVHINLGALNGSADFQNIEALLLYGSIDQPFAFASGIPIIDISAVQTLVLLTATAAQMTVLGGPTSYVGVASDLPLAYDFASGDAYLTAEDDSHIPFSFQNIQGIVGGAGNDVFIGDDRDNDFMPGLGQNFIEGGGGLDRIIVFTEQYDPQTTLVGRDGDTILVDGGAVSGGDVNGVQATGVERVLFSNDNLDLLGYFAADTGVGETAGTTYRTYQAAFDRVPDNDGLRFWIEQVDRGMSFVEMCSYFLQSDEFKQLYGADPNNHDYVEALYGNVLQREPDEAGIEFWQGILDKGDLDRAEMLLQFADSDENVALVAPAIDDGILIT